MELILTDKFVQLTAHVEHTEMTLPTHVLIVITHVNAVLEVLILIVNLVTMELIGMKENVELFAQQDTGKMMTEILVIIVTEAVSLVLEEVKLIVKNHAQKAFTGILEHVPVLAQTDIMKMMPTSKLVNHAT